MKTMVELYSITRLRHVVMLVILKHLFSLTDDDVLFSLWFSSFDLESVEIVKVVDKHRWLYEVQMIQQYFSNHVLKVAI